jgi:hypothetical protein
MPLDFQATKSTLDFQPLDFQPVAGSTRKSNAPEPRPGFWDSLGSTVKNPLSALWDQATAPPLAMESADGLSAITPAQWAQDDKARKARQSLQSRGVSSRFVGPPTDPEVVPGMGEMAGKVVGEGVNAATAAMLFEGAESPRLRGGAGGAVRAIPRASKAGLFRHLIPDPLAAAGELHDGIVEGRKGKLWTGPVARELRDRIFPPMPEPMVPPDATQPELAVTVHPHYAEGTHPVTGKVTRFQAGPGLDPLDAARDYIDDMRKQYPGIKVKMTHLDAAPAPPPMFGPNVTPYSPMTPETMQARIEKGRYPGLYTPPPDLTGYAPDVLSPDMAQYSRGAHPVQPPVEVGGGHVPDYSHPGISPDQLLAEPLRDPALGPTANSPGANARFKRNQYDAPRPKGPQHPNARNTAPPSVAQLPVVKPVEPTPTPMPPPPTAQPAAASGTSPIAGPKSIKTTPPPLPAPIQPESLPQPVQPLQPPVVTAPSLPDSFGDATPATAARFLERAKAEGAHALATGEEIPSPARLKQMAEQRAAVLGLKGPERQQFVREHIQAYTSAAFNPPTVNGAPQLTPMPAPPTSTTPANGSQSTSAASPAADSTHRFTHPKDWDLDLNRGLFATASELLDSPDYRQQVRRAAVDYYGSKSLSHLTLGEKTQFAEFYRLNKRFPVRGEALPTLPENFPPEHR